jgi:hypothetical protein
MSSPAMFEADTVQRMATIRKSEMNKTYAVRAGQRISVRCPFLYHGENFHGKGDLWDLSVSGWRATGDHPVTPGMSMPVYLELGDGGESKYLLIDSAIVRWSNGRDAGWEIQAIDTTSLARLNRFLDQVEPCCPASAGHRTGRSLPKR